MAIREAASGEHNWNSIEAWVGGVVPVEEDDVVFSATSGNVNVTAAAQCRSIESAVGYTGTLKIAKSVTVGHTTTNAGKFILKWQGGTCNITAQKLVLANKEAGATLTVKWPSMEGSPTSVEVNTEGTIKSENEFQGGTSAIRFFLTGGKYDTGGFAHTAEVSSFGATETTRELKLGSTVWTTEEWICAKPTGLTISAGTSKIVIRTIKFPAEATFAGGNQAFNEVEIKAPLNDPVIPGARLGNAAAPNNGSATISKLILVASAEHSHFAIIEEATLTVTTLETSNSGTEYISLQAMNTSEVTVPTAKAKIIKASGNITFEKFRIKGIEAEGAITWKALASINAGGCSGIRFQDEEESAFGPNFFGSFHGPGAY